jgi:hypothetical protein
LIEGFDLTLQLDAVDQKDRDGDALLPEGVEKGVLEVLPFGHGEGSCFL